MHTKRYISLLLFAAACADGPIDADTGGRGDDEAPLASYEGVVGGAPPNHMLPDDNKADAVYPRRHGDLVALQSPVKSQGRRGVCSIFATAALMESLYMMAGFEDPDFSEQFLQWSVKNEVGAWRNTSGSNAAENLDAIARYGIPVEDAWVYEPNPWTATDDPGCEGEESKRPVVCHTNGDPPETAMEAQRFFLPRGRWLNTNSIKAHLTTKKSGVQVGMDFFYQSWNHRLSTLPINDGYWRQGYVLFPNAKDVEESHKQRAGHSILIVGWDDDLEVPIVDAEGKQVLGSDGKPVTEKGFYIFKNSWGTAGFGIENPYGAGYGYLSMRYVNRYGSAYVSDVPRVTPPPPVDGGGGDRFEATPRAAIPDRDPAGVESTITVPAGAPVASVSVTVNITHTYIGDLTVTLTHEGRTVTLHAEEGGSDDDIRKTYVVDGFAGAARAGAWTLKVVDGAAADVGTLESWVLELR
jgi:hypothetical protein